MRVWSSETLGRGARGTLTAALAAVLLTGGARAETGLAGQWQDYEAVRAKTILELQPFRTEQSLPLASGGTVRLISLAPGANAWFLVQLDRGNGTDSYHLDNADPQGQTLALTPGPAPGTDPVLTIAAGDKTVTCPLWSGDPTPLAKARDRALPYVPLCGDRLYLRDAASGARSLRESVTDFLRDNVWGGEEVVQFVKNAFYKDAFAEDDTATSGAGTGAGDAGPAPAAIDPRFGDRPAIATDIGLGLSGTGKGRMAQGAWYPVAGAPGIFASAIQPQVLAPEVRDGKSNAARLDEVESNATDFLVAFDLSQFELGYALGTDHPGVGWSPRPPAGVRPRGLPGPDGISTSAPLVRLGMVSPALAARTAATFAGGFKRTHGAFKWGPFANVNEGSHYGFVEQGVIFSKLQPDLSTLYVLDDGTIGMKSWTKADDALLPRLRFARQNGVALVENGVPGKYVTQWGAGNWSGSAEAKLRTLRAGACMVGRGDRRYLIYGYFSTATPSAMARVFQGYGCGYAMLLDMNAPELTYLAIYAHLGDQIHVEHLVPVMGESDKRARDKSLLPRFLAFPDSRDFFYLTRKR